MADFEEQERQAAERYSTLDDEALQRLAEEAWTLTDAGKQALQAELSRRGLKVDLALVRPPEDLPRNWVTLRHFRDMPDALLAQGFLESAGVESFLVDETTIRMDWLWSNALGGIKLCVKPEDAATAAQLLDQKIPEKFNVEGVGDYEQPRCPQCHSLDISYEDKDKRIAYAGLLVVGFPIPVQRGEWECQSCGHAWKAPYDSAPGEK